MSKNIDLGNIFPPIPTPFERDEVAHDQLALNVEKWSKTGLKGLVAFGSNGEYPYLSSQEKLSVVKNVVQSAPKTMTIIAGTGCESTRETIELTNACAALGARAALVVTPHYYGDKMNTAALIRHYTAIADRTDIPILLYNVTKYTHINLPAEAVGELSHHPNIAGIKDSSGNIVQLGEYMTKAAAGFEVLVGTGGALLGALSIGCRGGIMVLANVAPTVCLSIAELFKKGDLIRARDLQLKMIPVNKALTGTYGVPGLKAALDLLGYFGGEPRSPLVPVSEKEKQEIKEILIKAGLL